MITSQRWLLSLVALLLLAACHAPPPISAAAPASLPLPVTPSPSAKPVCNYRGQAAMWLSETDSRSCRAPVEVDITQKILRFNCVPGCDSAKYQPLASLQNEVGPARASVASPRYVSLAPNANVDTLLGRYLRAWDRSGVSPAALAFVGFDTANVSTGVALRGLAPIAALQAAKTYVSTDPTLVLGLSGGFNLSKCQPTMAIGIAPIEATPLQLMTSITSKQRLPELEIVKQALGLDGSLRLESIPVKAGACIISVDSGFDPAEASVYYLRAGVIGLSSPIWYLPIQA